MSQGPTILVKKSDGTTVKMTMAEFKVYKESKKEVVSEEKKVDELSSRALERDLVLNSLKQDKQQPKQKKKEKKPKRYEKTGMIVSSPHELMEKEENLPAVIKTPKKIVIPQDLPIEDLIKNRKYPVASTKVENEDAIENEEVEKIANLIEEEILEKKPEPELTKMEKKQVPEVEEKTEEVLESVPTEIVEPDLKEDSVVAEKVIQAKEKKAEPELDVKKWRDTDYKSPLDEDLGTEFEKATENNQELQVNNIIASLSFNVASDLQGRLRTLILSRLKDVRTDEQLKEYAQKKSLDGGLGLDDNQAKELIKLTSNAKKSEAGTSIIQSAEESFLESVGASGTKKPSKTDDVVSQIIEKENARTSGLEKLDIAQMVSQKEPEKTTVQAPVITKISSIKTGQRSDYAHKTPMHDVKMPAGEVRMGPIDEIRTFKAEDFHRLDKDIEKAVEKFMDKIQSLKNESFLLYLDAVKAWQTSPFYKNHQEVLLVAVNNSQKIEDVLNSGKYQISLEDFFAVNKISKKVKF